MGIWGAHCCPASGPLRRELESGHTHDRMCTHMKKCVHTQNTYTCTHNRMHTHEKTCANMHTPAHTTEHLYTRQNMCTQNVYTHAHTTERVYTCQNVCAHTSTHYRMCTHKTKRAQTQMCPPRHTSSASAKATSSHRHLPSMPTGPQLTPCRVWWVAGL